MIIHFPAQAFGLCHITDDHQTTRCGLALAVSWETTKTNEIGNNGHAQCPHCGPPAVWRELVSRLSRRDAIIVGRQPRAQVSRAVFNKIAEILSLQSGFEVETIHLPTGGSIIKMRVQQSGHEFKLRITG